MWAELHEKSFRRLGAAPTPPRLHEILQRAHRAGAHIGTVCQLIHEREGKGTSMIRGILLRLFPLLLVLWLEPVHAAAGPQCGGDLDGDGLVTVDELVTAVGNLLNGCDVLPGPRFVDNGDGTVTDNQTGLMWEQKVPGEGCLHCEVDPISWTRNGLMGSPSTPRAWPTIWRGASALAGTATCCSRVFQTGSGARSADEA